jgi:hypothetical protein
MNTKVDYTRFAQGGLIGLLFSSLVVACGALLVQQTTQVETQAATVVPQASLVKSAQDRPKPQTEPALVPAAPVVGQGLYQDTTSASRRLEDAQGWISFIAPEGWVAEVDAELVTITKGSAVVQIALESAPSDMSSRARLASELGVSQSALSIFAGEERGLTGHRGDRLGFIFSDSGRYATLTTSSDTAFEASQEIARSLRWSR